MTEQQLLQENERLRRELAEANKSRERLREMLCAFFPLDPPDVLEKQVLEMMQQPMHGIEDIIAELHCDEPPEKNRQIPA
jgi:hypothetical protein